MMQAALGHYAVPDDIQPVIEQLWGSPDTYLYFDDPQFHVYIHYDPEAFDAHTPWVKVLAVSWNHRERDVLKSAITSASLASCIRTDDPTYDYVIREDDPPITPSADGQVRYA